VTLLDSIDIVQKLNGAFQMPLLFASSFPGKENPIKTEWKTLSETGGDWWDQEGTPFSPSVSDDWLNEIKTKTNNLSKDKLNNILNFDLNNLNFFNFGLTGEANKPTDQ
jgi:hypothetical protein